MLEAFPFVPLGTSIRTGIGIFSYDGNLTYGVTGDWESAPDIRILARGIEEGTQELLALASPGPRSTRGRSSRSRTTDAVTGRGEGAGWTRTEIGRASCKERVKIWVVA